jgi:hypothetical protein
VRTYIANALHKVLLIDAKWRLNGQEQITLRLAARREKLFELPRAGSGGDMMIGCRNASADAPLGRL